MSRLKVPEHGLWPEAGLLERAAIRHGGARMQRGDCLFLLSSRNFHAN
jgi:hypothetical protein